MFIHRNKNSNRMARLNVRKALRSNGEKIAKYRFAYFFMFMKVSKNNL